MYEKIEKLSKNVKKKFLKKEKIIIKTIKNFQKKM